MSKSTRSGPTTSVPVAGRLEALDALRGLIMMLMAIDHASLFVASTHFAEFWGLPLPDYGGPLPLLTRVVSHLCAPGFFFLMGTGMYFFAATREERGWPNARIRRHFVVRGAVLIAVEIFVVNPAWLLGSLDQILAGAGPMDEMPGGGSTGMLPIGVLLTLGAAMILAAPLLRIAPLVVAAIGGAILVACQVLLPGPENAHQLYPALSHLLLIAGHRDVLLVLYPFAPWLGVTLLGVAFGVVLRANPAATLRALVPASAVLLVLFVGVRIAGGFGTHHPMPGDDWVALLSVTKYPPSLAYLLMTLGANGLLLGALARMQGRPGAVFRTLVVFGRAPLFFYVVHLYLYAVLGLMIPGATSLAAMYPVWVVGLVILYPLCRRYDGFKRRQAADSLWRLF